jgi:hypothetical protein
MLERRAAPIGREVPFWTLVFAVVASAIFGWLAPDFEARVGQPAVDLDSASAPARTLALIAGYGVAGRQAYLVFLSLNCLLPVAGSLLLLRLYYATTRGWAWTRLQSRTLVAIGVLPALADLIENTLYALLAVLYPRHATLLAEVAYAATLLKLASASLALLTLLLLVSLWLRRYTLDRRFADSERAKATSR